MRFLRTAGVDSVSDIDLTGTDTPYQCPCCGICSVCDFFCGMAAGLLEFCIQSSADNHSIAAWHTQFQLSAFVGYDVSGSNSVGSKISSGGIVFDLDMVYENEPESW